MRAILQPLIVGWLVIVGFIALFSAAYLVIGSLGPSILMLFLVGNVIALIIGISVGDIRHWR